MKRFMPAISALAGFLLIAFFILWSFRLHGTLGLFRVNGQFHFLFLYAGGFGLLLLLGSILYFVLKKKPKTSRLGWLAAILLFLSVPGILGPPLAFLYADGVFSGSLGATPPQLLIADGSGENGIPNLAVTYNTLSPEIDTLTWGTADKQVDVNENKAEREHVFMLRDLAPAGSYTYRINHGVPYSFTTPAAGDELHFAMSSDAHFGAGDNRPELTAKMLGEIAGKANDFDLFLSAGDLVDDGFSASQWGEAFRAFSAASSVIPTRFAAGNHETLFSGLSLYEKYAYPAGMDLQTGSRLWYRIDVGKVHFLVLDVEWSAESYSSAQAGWLEAQLKDIPSDDWKIVVSHGFYYSSGSVVGGWKWYDNPETIDAMVPLFEKYGVNLVLSGHNHQMEWLQHNGVSYAVCGAFGGLPDAARTYVSPASLWYLNDAYGFLDVKIKGDTCAVTFMDSDDSAIKTFSISR